MAFSCIGGLPIFQMVTLLALTNIFWGQTNISKIIGKGHIIAYKQTHTKNYIFRQFRNINIK